MTYHGTMKNGTLVFDEREVPPDGTRLVIQPASTVDDRPLSEILEPLIGCLDGLPRDFAHNHDHYIHGALKRE